LLRKTAKSAYSRLSPVKARPSCCAEPSQRIENRPCTGRLLNKLKSIHWAFSLTRTEHHPTHGAAFIIGAMARIFNARGRGQKIHRTSNASLSVRLPPMTDAGKGQSHRIEAIELASTNFRFPPPVPDDHRRRCEGPERDPEPVVEAGSTLAVFLRRAYGLGRLGRLPGGARRVRSITMKFEQ
jgi:hypothetical protein